MRKISFTPNILYKPVFSTRARYIDLWGGRARGASHFATDYFLFMITQPGYFRGCFMRAIYSDVRGSLWQDFKDRVEAAIDKGELDPKDILLNESKMSVRYIPTGNTIVSKGFKKSAGTQSAKLKSLAGMTHVIIEECEEVEKDDFTKLDDSFRTTKVDNIQIFRLFNPPSKNHWLIKIYYNLLPSGYDGWYTAVPKEMPELLSIHSTYKDNLKNVNESTRRNYRNYGNEDSPMYNPDFYYRDVKGLISEGKKGRIFKKCYNISLKLFNELPYPKFYGLDFGFSSDPTVLVKMKYHNGKLFRHQMIYETELTNEDLVKRMKEVGLGNRSRVYADSAEPKSIRTIVRSGIICIPAVKGPDSIQGGIKILQGMDIYTTEESKDLWLENEEYSWELDSTKEPTDKPIDNYNHGWDATRYAVMSHITKPGKLTVAGSKKEKDKSWEDW